MSRTKINIGKSGEIIAEKFLRSRGLWILDRNFTTPFGEIDLVARQNGCIVFVEVKTRTSERFGSPLSSITKTKRKHIVNNCLYYLKKHGLCGTKCRIDVIGIKLNHDRNLKVLRHVRNAIQMT